MLVIFFSLISIESCVIHLVQAAMERQADELGQLDCQSRQLKQALAALHEEEDHSLQKQRRMVAAAEEEVWLHDCWAARSLQSAVMC